jgi:hypothetical protein
MNQKQVAILKGNHAETDTKELLTIWKENDTENYTDEAFEAIKQVLQERGVSIPTQDEFIPKEDREAILLVRNAEDPLHLGMANEVIKYEIEGAAKGFESLSAKRLYVGSRGLCLTIIPESCKAKELFVDWATLRELENNLKAKNTFVVNVGEGIKDLRFKIRIVRGDASQLSEVLEKLPDTARCGKCPKCSGLVKQGVCESCGVDFRTSLRERGFRLIGAGIATTIIGAFLCFFVAHWIASQNSPFWIIWYGPILVGVLLIIRGCYEVIWRKKM